MVVMIILLIIFQTGFNSIETRYVRAIGTGSKGTSVSTLSNQTDLNSIDGIERVTKLVLLKSDSLPDEPDEQIESRYVDSLMGTLYTGLRKPFKSVSADILGIFPSFEEIQVRCEETGFSEIVVYNESESIFESSTKESRLSGSMRSSKNLDIFSKSIEAQNNYSMKPSLQVCEAVTKDCLSMEELVDIMPASVDTFDRVLVRICPVILFRIMNQFCNKAEYTSGISSQQSLKYHEDVEVIGDKRDNETLNENLLQYIKNLHMSEELATKKPQKLHKKLKMQTNYKNGGNIIPNRMQNHDVDEQLMKIRLKLNEPSIEKVWIFSLLFVILSIVVSMGGLIVLPFVRKTTRRRILTLFEGLAVGGLTGSATLHMFPQAFGLVDENYHKYFWRIFVVFFGIYLCYLCERIIKIIKVVRAKMSRRSKASLMDLGYYDIPMNVASTYSNHKFRSSKNYDITSELNSSPRLSGRSRSKKWGADSASDASKLGVAKHGRFLGRRLQDLSIKNETSRVKRIRRSPQSKTASKESSSLFFTETKPKSDLDSFDSEPMDRSNNPTRQRLVKCLRSVQKQFSPVYSVQSQTTEGTLHADEQKRRGRVSIRDDLRKDTRSLFAKLHASDKYSSRRPVELVEIETMLYHRSQMHSNRKNASEESGYLQQRLSSVKDVAAERQDQDNASRMSVDTVAWMIVFGDAVLNVIDGLSIGAAFERNILAGISISVAVMLEEVTHRLGTFAVLIRAGMSMKQSLLCTFLSACALFPGLVIGILLSDATEDATPYIFCAAGGIFLYMALVDVMKEMNRSIENAMRKDIKSTLQIFALQNVGIILAVTFLSFLALYEQEMDFEEYQMQYNHRTRN